MGYCFCWCFFQARFGTRTTICCWSTCAPRASMAPKPKPFVSRLPSCWISAWTFFGSNQSMVVSNYSGRHVYPEMTRRPCFPISNLWNFWMQCGWEDLRRWEIRALGLSFAPCWMMFVSRPSHPSQFAGNASTMEWQVGWAHRYPHIWV